MKREIIELLRELSEAPGAPGREGPIRKLFRKHLSGPYSYDSHGSIIREKAGSSPTPRVMLAAHMDEVALIVHSITKEGFIRFAPLGGWWSHVLPAKRVTVFPANGKKISGVIAAKPPHFLSPQEREKLLKIEQMFIDLGAPDAEFVRNELGIREGDPIILDSKFEVFGDGEHLLGKAFDDRIGLTVAILATKQLEAEGHPNTLLTVGTVQEEVGTRGAQTASFKAKPDFALVLEGTPADDMPGNSPDERQAQLGKGPQIRIMDPTAIGHRKLIDLLLEVAEREKLPCQLAVRKSGGTDARTIHLQREGVPTAVISVPVRYAHTPNSIANIRDIEATIKLISSTVKQLSPETAQKLTDYSDD